MRVYKGEVILSPWNSLSSRCGHTSCDYIYPADDLQPPSEIDTESYRGHPLRTGHRYFNLVELVNAQEKYLLENSKTNAMISVSLDITVVKAQAEYTKHIPLSVFVSFTF